MTGVNHLHFSLHTNNGFNHFEQGKQVLISNLTVTRVKNENGVVA